jgi:hypothetical protein
LLGLRDAKVAGIDQLSCLDMEIPVCQPGCFTQFCEAHGFPIGKASHDPESGGEHQNGVKWALHVDSLEFKSVQSPDTWPVRFQHHRQVVTLRQEEFKRFNFMI